VVSASFAAAATSIYIWDSSSDVSETLKTQLNGRGFDKCDLVRPSRQTSAYNGTSSLRLEPYASKSGSVKIEGDLP
jgi:hypothetical protein